MELSDKIVLPKKHLSWSQFSMWKSSPDRYKREYFTKGRRLDTEALRFGKGFALSIEDGSYKQEVPDLEVYSEVEYEIKENIQGVNTLSFIDSYDPLLNVFREYKTGRVPWTKAKVQQHGQLLYYAVVLRKKTGKMPEYCHLDWIETEHSDGDDQDFWSRAKKKLVVTGDIKSFEREFDERELDRMEQDILKTAQQISNAYKEFIYEI